MPNINQYSPQSGRVIGEDGQIYNIVDLLQNISGGGGSGMEFHFGNTAPDTAVGQSGDVYLNTSNGDFYQKEETWNLIANLKGPKGDTGSQGLQGPKGDTGEQGPAGANGFPTEQQWNELVARVSALEGGA